MGGGSGVISCASISPAPAHYEYKTTKLKSKSATGHKSIATTPSRRPSHAKAHHHQQQQPSSSIHHALDRDAASVTSITSEDTTGTARHLPPAGLQNVGNTCYANAALQCILSTALAHALLDPKSTHIFRRYSSNPGLLALGSGSADSENEDEYDSDDDGSRTIDEREARRSARKKAREMRIQNRERLLKREKCQWVTGELTDITRIYTASHLHHTNTNTNALHPHHAALDGWQSIFHLCSVTNNQRVVDPGGITRHVNKLSPCLRPYQQEDAHEFLRSLLSSLTLDGHNKKLSSLFDGLLESAVTCQTCHRASITRDRYMDLSLDVQAGDIQDLTSALGHFTQTELLDADNKVHCDRCRCKRMVSKGLRLATAPTVLVCHLKRFAFDIYGRTRRLSKHIRYPLSLEIGEFMSRANQSKPPPYELVGVLVHAGKRCESGHYLAFIKNGGRWYKANDEVVAEVSEEAVLAQQAYILFYEVEGMRVRHGYKGFKRYHRDKSTDRSRTRGSSKAPETGNGGNASASAESSSSANDDPDPLSTPPSKVSALMDGMLNLCGSVETVRDAICDSDRKAKRKSSSKNRRSRDRDRRGESRPPSSQRRGSSSKRKNRKKEDIFRRPADRPIRASTDCGPRPRRYHPESSSMHKSSRSVRSSGTGGGVRGRRADFSVPDGDMSVLSTDSRMIRSVSSNNMFEKEDEAISCYENESYASQSPRRKPRSRRSLNAADRSMSPLFRYGGGGDTDQERKSDTAVMQMTSSSRLLKSFSQESYASRSPHKKNPRQRSRNHHNAMDRSISPPLMRFDHGLDHDSHGSGSGPRTPISLSRRKFSSAPRSIKENDSRDFGASTNDVTHTTTTTTTTTTTPFKHNLSSSMHYISPMQNNDYDVSGDSSNPNSKLPPLPPK